MGLWHGANWTFLLWGLYHATLITIYRILSPLFTKWDTFLLQLLGLSITLPLIMLSWIPFRSETITSSLIMWKKLLKLENYGWLGMRENTYLIAALVLVAVLSTPFIRKIYTSWIKKSHCYKSQLAVESILFTIIISFVFVFLRPIKQFIYFQLKKTCI